MKVNGMRDVPVIVRLQPDHSRARVTRVPSHRLPHPPRVGNSREHWPFTIGVNGIANQRDHRDRARHGALQSKDELHWLTRNDFRGSGCCRQQFQGFVVFDGYHQRHVRNFHAASWIKKIEGVVFLSLQ